MSVGAEIGAGGAVAEGAPPGGLLAWVATTDHKRIALRMAAVSFGFFLIGGIFALVMRSELADPGLQLVGRDTYNQLFTMHGSTMIFLVLTPLALALGVYLVPLQIGAADIAAPRVTLAGHWFVVVGGLTMYSSFLTDHGAGKAGWTAYYPLSGDSATPGTGMDLWVVGVILVGAGLTLVAACILATIIRLRAPGMTMLRLPVFSWTMLATVLMVVMSVPVLAVGMALLLADRLGASIYESSGGPIAYQNLFWFFGHPAVYVMFFPFLGITADVVATFARKRFTGYRPLILALIVFTGLSMSVWAHHMFTTDQVANKYFSLTSTALVVAAGTEYFAIIATLIGGSILLRTPMLFALGFFLQFLIGGLSGVILASPPLDYHAHDSYFVVAHFHYTLFAGSLFAGFAAAYYWFPKWTGAMLRDSLGKVHFALIVLGTNLTFFPMFLLGYDGMPRRVADYASDAGFTDLNRLSTLGSYFIALGVAVFLYNLFVSLRKREPAGDDPWEGHSLEWATSSPPPRYNFRSLPPITSHAPLLDRRIEAAKRDSSREPGEPG
jgi:cytochrome c oxidase subunit I